MTATLTKFPTPCIRTEPVSQVACFHHGLSHTLKQVRTSACSAMQASIIPQRQGLKQGQETFSQKLRFSGTQQRFAIFYAGSSGHLDQR